MAHSFSPLLVHTAFSSLSLVVFPWLLMIKWTPSPLAPVRRNKNQACRWTEQSFPGQVVGKPLLFSFIPHSIVPCITGGVSVGDRDLIKPLLAAHGTIHFGRVLMKPGKPLTFATLELPSGRQLLVFGLPGGGIEFALKSFWSWFRLFRFRWTVSVFSRATFPEGVKNKKITRMIQKPCQNPGTTHHAPPSP